MDKIDYFLSRAKDEVTAVVAAHPEENFNNGAQFKEAKDLIYSTFVAISDKVILTEELTPIEGLRQISAIRVEKKPEEAEKKPEENAD